MEKLYRIAAYIFRVIEMYIVYCISFLLRIFPIKHNKIVVCSYFGNDYSDNPKYIVEEILKSKNNYDIVWALKKKLINNNALPKSIRTVKYNSLAMLYELSTAKIWIDNARKVMIPLKRRNQFYFQVWHGSIGLKKIELDTKETLTKIYLKKASIDSKMADYFVSCSKWSNQMYRRAFNFKGEILEIGTPRNDIFYNKNKHKAIKNKVYKYFNIDKNTKIIVYGPTFRNNKGIDIYLWDYNKLIEKYKNEKNEKVKILIRLHPNVQNETNKLDIFNEDVLNATPYPDMQELIIASDLVITDYSSIMCDSSLLNRKCILYCPDLDEYLKERELYFDIKKLPYPFTENENDLIEKALKIDQKEYNQNIKEFMNKIGNCETGKSAKYIANLIMEICDKNEKK